MLYWERQLTQGTRLAIWKIEESEEELLSLFPVLREEYTREIASYKSETRRLEYLSVRALLLYLLKDENKVLHDSDGRPSLEGKSLKISISHTKGYAAVILSSESVVGIDVEVVRNKIFRVKHKFLSTEELSNIDRTNELRHLLLHWCAKETLYKMASVPLPEFSEQMTVESFSCGEEEGTFLAYETATGEEYRMSYVVFDEFVMTYCVR